MIESFDPVSLPLWLLAAFAAAQYPLALMFGAECSLCCCRLCNPEFDDCCGEDFTRISGGVCCDEVWHPADEDPPGECCDNEWHTDEGVCCNDEWHPAGEDPPGECCNNEWRTDDGECCNDEWYPAENPCPPGQVYLNLGPDNSYPIEADQTCCGCFPDQIYDPRVEELVDTETVQGDLLCGCGELCIPEDENGDPVECKQRCCKVDENTVTCEMLTQTDCEDQGGVSSAGCCDLQGGGCDVPCCREDADGTSTCALELNTECFAPAGVVGTIQENIVDCEQACLGTCCIDGVPTETLLTQEACDDAGGCWAGVGSVECLTGCRPPFDENCCESVISDASGLTFTQPRRKSCEPTDTLWMVTATGTTDSPILIHGVPFGQDATPAKRCPINITFPICGDSFNVEPMPCDSSFRRLEITVCWAPEGETLETLDYSGCSDITLWLGECTRGCETVVNWYDGAITVGATVQMFGDATINSSGSGAMIWPAITPVSNGCTKRLTLSGTNDATNEIGVISNSPDFVATSLRKTGGGTWRLAQNNLYSGATEILDGTVIVGIDTQQNSGAFGLQGGITPEMITPVGNPLAIGSGTVALLLELDVQFTKYLKVPAGVSQLVILGGANTSGESSFDSSNSFILAGSDVTLQAATGGVVRFENTWLEITGFSTTLEVDVTVGTAGNFGDVLLTNDLSTTGAIQVQYGRLHVKSPITADSGVTLNGSTAELLFDDVASLSSALTLTQGSMLVSGGISLDGTVTVVGTIGLDVDAGGDAVVTAALAGSGTLEKTGSGTLRLTGANTFAGTLDVQDGEVVVESLIDNPGGLATSATFTPSTLTVQFSGDPEAGDEFVLLAGPVDQAYGAVTLTGTSATATFDSATSTLTID